MSKAIKFKCKAKCYSQAPYPMCPFVDTCPEISMREFIGTVGTVLILLSIPVAAVVAIILFIARWFG